MSSIRKYKPDIINSFYFFPNGMIATFFGILFRKPVINSLIGTDLAKHLSRKFYSRSLIGFLKKSTIITVTGTHSKKLTLELGIPEEKILILPNSINVEDFLPTECNKIFDFIFIGNLVPVKQVDKIISFVHLLKNETKNKSIKMAIVGKGKEKEELVVQTKELGLTDNIVFLGFRTDIRELLSQSKFLILFSESEGLPAVVLEAFCSGVIPIVNDVGDLTDVCIDNHNSIVLSINDSSYSESVGRVDELLTNKTNYERISKNAFESCMNNDYTKTAERWDDIFEVIEMKTIEKK